MRIIRWIIVLISLPGIFGCSYSLRMNQYPHLRNVFIMPIENRTGELDIDEDLRNTLLTSFQQDGRLRIVYEDPDSIIECEILDYESKIFGFDIEQNVEEYMVTIIFDLTFTDLLRNEVIWENSSIRISERYYPRSPQDVQITTEQGAQEKIFENLFNLIIRNTLESW